MGIRDMHLEDEKGSLDVRFPLVLDIHRVTPNP